MLRPPHDSRKPEPTIATIRPLQFRPPSRRHPCAAKSVCYRDHGRRRGYIVPLKSLTFSHLRRRPTVTTAVLNN